MKTAGLSVLLPLFMQMEFQRWSSVWIEWKEGGQLFQYFSVACVLIEVAGT
jgi:hypothetical protein